MSEKIEEEKSVFKMAHNLEFKIEKMLSKTESLVLLCSKASGYWSMIKFCFAIPLVITSSAMCVINSISDNAEDVKIPNICVNAVSVLIMSLNNSIKASEKCDLFRRIGQQLLLLTGKIENDNEIKEDDFKLLAMSYENLVNDIPFSLNWSLTRIVHGSQSASCLKSTIACDTCAM